MAILHRILAVDDNPRNLAIIEKALDGEYELVCANSGEAALELAGRFRPDVILLDIMMPGLDGYETCRRLRAARVLASSKIIMLSARATATDRLEGYAAGADDYVTKPFDVDELLAKLRVYVRLKSVEELDRLKSDLLHLLSHETRTPLSSVLMPADLLLADAALTPKQRELVTMMQRAGLRLLQLIEKVSFLGELKAGAVQAERECLPAAGLARACITNACQQHDQPASRVVLDAPDGDGLVVTGDLRLLSTSLAALLDNALRLSPADAPIEVRVTGGAHWCSIAVTDRGPGIAPEFLDRIFDEFAIEDVRHHSRGLGLSLATARLIAEQQGGSLTATSELGQGATFTLRLPLAESARSAA